MATKWQWTCSGWEMEKAREEREQCKVPTKNFSSIYATRRSSSIMVIIILQGRSQETRVRRRWRHRFLAPAEQQPCKYLSWLIRTRRMPGIVKPFWRCSCWLVAFQSRRSIELGGSTRGQPRWGAAVHLPFFTFKSPSSLTHTHSLFSPAIMNCVIWIRKAPAALFIWLSAPNYPRQPSLGQISARSSYFHLPRTPCRLLTKQSPVWAKSKTK